MYKILQSFIVFTLFLSGQKTMASNTIKTINKEKNNTVILLDTVANGKYLKIYSLKNDPATIIAAYGNKNQKHKVNLSTKKYNMLRTPVHVDWITQKSFAIVGGCGSGCKYVIIFNTDKKEPLIEEVLYYPTNNKKADFKTDNINFYIAASDNFKDRPCFTIVDTDSQKRQRVVLPDSWKRGLGVIFSIVDKIIIKNATISVYQNQENGATKKLSRSITI